MAAEQQVQETLAAIIALLYQTSKEERVAHRLQEILFFLQQFKRSEESYEQQIREECATLSVQADSFCERLGLDSSGQENFPNSTDSSTKENRQLAPFATLWQEKSWLTERCFRLQSQIVAQNQEIAKTVATLTQQIAAFPESIAIPDDISTLMNGGARSCDALSKLQKFSELLGERSRRYSEDQQSLRSELCSLLREIDESAVLEKFTNTELRENIQSTREKIKHLTLEKSRLTSDMEKDYEQLRHLSIEPEQIAPEKFKLSEMFSLRSECDKLRSFRIESFRERYRPDYEFLEEVLKALDVSEAFPVPADKFCIEGINQVQLEICKLKPIYESAHSIRRLLGERTEFLEKIREFEVSASDPKRLFRSSVQLLQEERFRKGCQPHLQQLENAIVDAIRVVRESGFGNAFSSDLAQILKQSEERKIKRKK